MKILFRVDASPTIGLGHLRRTLALATVMAKQGHEPKYLIHDGGELLPIEPPFPRVSEVGGGWDLAVVDSYLISQHEYKLLRSQSKKTAVVSDGKDPGFDCDALIDHNLYARPDLYPDRAGSRTKLLLGPAYAMIREEIRQARDEGFEVSDGICRILLTLGGGDQHDNLLRLLRFLAQTARGAEVSILSPKCVSLDIHSGVATETAVPSNQYRLVHDQPDVGSLMRQCDLAVTGAGVTSLELACIGVPAIHVVLADNQMLGAQAAQEQGIGLNLGNVPAWDLSTFQIAYRALESREKRQAMSLAGRSLVDGLGAQRLAEALQHLA